MLRTDESIDRTPDDVEALVRTIVSAVESTAPVSIDTDDDQVLLDIEVGDVRCLIVRHARPSPMTLLSPREREIARMVAQGYPNKTIASVLDISSWTVSSHLRRIFVKLQVSSRAAMATRLSLEYLAAAEPVRESPFDETEDDTAIRDTPEVPAYPGNRHYRIGTSSQEAPEKVSGAPTVSASK
jgi:DNA-binding CsgD family transcriptional regulator